MDIIPEGSKREKAFEVWSRDGGGMELVGIDKLFEEEQENGLSQAKMLELAMGLVHGIHYEVFESMKRVFGELVMTADVVQTISDMSAENRKTQERGMRELAEGN